MNHFLFCVFDLRIGTLFFFFSLKINFYQIIHFFFKTKRQEKTKKKDFQSKKNKKNKKKKQYVFSRNKKWSLVLKELHQFLLGKAF